MVGLRLFAVEFGEQVEADFQRFYGLHIGHLGDRRVLSWRRFRVLLHGLPSDSALRTEMSRRAAADEAQQEKSGPNPLDVDLSTWSLTDQLLAHVVDILAMANYQRGGGKGSKPKLLTAGTRRSARPAPGVDVRAILSGLAPARQEEPDVSP